MAAVYITNCRGGGAGGGGGTGLHTLQQDSIFVLF